MGAREASVILLDQERTQPLGQSRRTIPCLIGGVVGTSGLASDSDERPTSGARQWFLCAEKLAIDAGPWTAGIIFHAWCVAHYKLREGRIAQIEQHDCYQRVTV
jgi:hypothetical protein